MVLKPLIWALSVYSWYLKARDSDERNNRAFGTNEKVACYGIKKAIG